MTIRLAALLTLLLTGFTFVSEVAAQKDTKVYRFGWVSLAPAPTQSYATYEALKVRLAEHGYIEGKNITFEPWWLSGNSDRAPEALAEMERRGVDLIFAPSTTMARISQDIVKKTPVIIYSCDAFDHVVRLARHGRNVSGVTCMTSELTPKRLELLKEAVPTASRIVFFSEPEDSPSGLKRAQDTAPRLGIKLTSIGFKTRADVPRALDVVAKERPHALFVYPDAISISARGEIAEFALKHRLPTMYAFREFVDAGGLMSYGANSVDMFRLVADQSARVLGGAAPKDVPILQATRFELVINLKTAKALGLTIPQSLLLRADQIIE